MQANQVKIIDYKAGNAPSVLNAVTKLGFPAEFARTSADLQDLGGSSLIILPGVGSAKATMDSLREMGLLSILEEKVLNEKVCFLGICVGMQILFEHSEEDDTFCLGWLKGRVVKFDKSKVRVPQMGWNYVKNLDGHFYFVNSYYAIAEDSADLWGTADYNGEFAAAVRRGNIYGTQFHIEKSGKAGLSLLSGLLSGGGGYAD